MSRRCFHDDWARIFDKLRENNEYVASYNPFHADKALVFLRNTKQARLLYGNKGWLTVGTFYVKFEQWDPEMHATPKLIPSYDGWV